MTGFLVLLAIGVGSYLLRISMLVLGARIGVPRVIERLSGYALPVSFAALASSALAPHLVLRPAAIAPLGSVIVAVAAVRRTGSAHAALLAGLPALWILTLVVGR